ncbi:hypothetical protein [Mesorhizobium sp. SARCC-RB16n]|nr:hypothetical protein [Mesorhizobium sp. SARCC-RB16n]
MPAPDDLVGGLEQADSLCRVGGVVASAGATLVVVGRIIEAWTTPP